MAEEDLIFGKKRHMFGGIEPSNMLEFATSLVNGAVNIKATLPNDTVINGQTLCTVAGAVIRKKLGSYPVDEFDGEYVADINNSKTIIDSSADTMTNIYYSAFPYSTQGVYNRNPANRVLYIKRGGAYLYGYDLDTTDSNPDTRVTYPSDVDNYGYTPAAMNFTSGVFNYGSWPSAAGSKSFMPKPCMLSYNSSDSTHNGKILHYLNPNDYTKQVNGSDSSVSDYSTNANAMMEWPKIYTYRWMDGDIYKFRCSSAKLTSDYDCWCNYIDSSKNEADHFYTAIYEGTSQNNESGSYPLRSLSGYSVFSYTSPSGSGSSMISAKIAKNGEGWGMECISHRLLIQDLLVLMAKTTDCQTAYGTGFSYESQNQTTGSMNKKGLFWGTNDGTAGIKVFGMEQWWSSSYRRMIRGFMRGMDMNNNKLEPIDTYRQTFAITVTGGTDGYLPLTATSSTGYIKSMFFTKFGRLPIGSTETGSGTTYETDHFWSNEQDSTTIRYSVAYVPSSPSLSNIQYTGPFNLGILIGQSGYTPDFGANITYLPPTT